MNQQTPVIYENGIFIDVQQGRTLPPSWRLEVRNGEIAAMGPKVFGRGGERCIDLGGAFVVPGLINAHAHIHLAMPAIAASLKTFLVGRVLRSGQVKRTLTSALEHGVTTIRDGATEDLGDSSDINRMREQGLLVAPRIVQAVAVSMEGSCWTRQRGMGTRVQHALAGLPHLTYEHPRSGAVTFPRGASSGEVRAAVDKAVMERHARAIKVYDQREALVSFRPGAPLMSKDHLSAIVEQAHAHGVPVIMHQFSVESFRRGVEAGVDVMVHLPLDEPLTADDVSRFIHGNTILEPTLSLLGALCFRGVLPSFEEKRMATVEKLRHILIGTLGDYWLPPLARGAAADLQRVARGNTKLLNLLDFSAAYAYHAPLINHGVSNLRRLFDAGATVACGNDGGIPPLTAAMVGLELAHLEAFLDGSENRRRFDALHALQAVTVNAARSLAYENLHGVIEPGARADLVAYGVNPLVDASCLGGPATAVIMEGEVVFSAPV